MRPRQRGAAAVAASVLLVHALLLGLVPHAPGPGWRAQPPRVVQVRRIVADASVPAPLAAAASPPATVARGPLAQPRQTAPTAPVPAVAPMPPAQPATESEATPDPGGLTLPQYATLVPPPLSLVFELRRGLAGGSATLNWRPQQDSYALSLQGQAFGAAVLAWSSQGGFDGAGIAPLRYTESRRGREVRAANFQRDKGIVTFSGPTTQHPLIAGGQDRLSWMVQLASVVAANPALAQEDAQVSMWVVGTRGDAEVWTFTVLGRVTLQLPIGTVADAVHLIREPRRPYDTQVQVWLDPARHYLPAQAFLLVRASGEGTEFRLQEVQGP